MIIVDVGIPSNCEECPFRPCKAYRKYIKESRGWLPLNFRLENCLITELVRCKDCEHKDKPTCPEVDNIWFTDNDFCSWAKRKGGTVMTDIITLCDVVDNCGMCPRYGDDCDGKGDDDD